MLTFEDRLAAVALRAVVAEVAEDPQAARELLRRVLGGPAATSERPPSRPARSSPGKARGTRAGGPRLADPKEVARLAQQLVEHYGSQRAAAEAVKTCKGMVARWLKGHASLATLKRLRDAVEEVRAVSSEAAGEGALS